MVMNFSPWNIDSCDGIAFDYVATSIAIAKFEGVKKIIELDAYPSCFHPSVEVLGDRLYARGKKLEQVNGFHHMSYSGFYTARSSRQLRKRHVCEKASLQEESAN